MEATAIQHVPAIIEQAAKSPLGLFALMVIALSVLGFVFFRTSSERTRVAMFVMLFIGVVSFGVATLRSVPADTRTGPADAGTGPANAAAGSGNAAADPAASVPMADIDGDWLAEVTYDWGAVHNEAFTFTLDGGEVLGTASFLGSDRTLFEGRLDGDRLRFIVRTQEILGDAGRRDVTHHYTGRFAGDAAGDRIEFVLRTEGGFSEHVPVKFVAMRAASK